MNFRFHLLCCTNYIRVFCKQGLLLRFRRTHRSNGRRNCCRSQNSSIRCSCAGISCFLFCGYRYDFSCALRLFKLSVFIGIFIYFPRKKARQAHDQGLIFILFRAGFHFWRFRYSCCCSLHRGCCRDCLERYSLIQEHVVVFTGINQILHTHQIVFHVFGCRVTVLKIFRQRFIDNLLQCVRRFRPISL